MYLFLSFVVALISLYYIGVMVDSYNADTTYLTPLVGLLIYSILSIVRELKKEPLSWLSYEDDYRNCQYRGNGQYYSDYNNNQFTNAYGARGGKTNESTEYFTPTKREKKDDSDGIIHYPSNSEVREKIKELEKNRWFRIKRCFYSIFAYDITEKYYEEYKKPYKVNRKGKVISAPTNKEDNSRFQPSTSWYTEKEKEEYNAVTKLMGGRSCEIALTDAEFALINQLEDTNSFNENG